MERAASPRRAEVSVFAISSSPEGAIEVSEHVCFSAFQADGGPLVSLREMQALSRILNEAWEMELGPAWVSLGAQLPAFQGVISRRFQCS